MSGSTVVELIGNPRAGSRTRSLADSATRALLAELGRTDEPLVLELAEIVAVSFGPQAVAPSAPVADPLGAIRSARLLVVATPTYKATFTGLLKVFLDQLGHRELAGIVAVPVAVAAAEPHLVSVTAALRDLLLELGATVPAPPLGALESQLSTPDEFAAAWAKEHAAAIGDALGSG